MKTLIKQCVAVTFIMASMCAAYTAVRKEKAAKEAIPRLIRDMVAIPGKNFKMGKYEVTQAQWAAAGTTTPGTARRAIGTTTTPTTASTTSASALRPPRM